MPPLPRGVCPVCLKEVALRKGNVLREHTNQGGKLVCAGSGKEMATMCINCRRRIGSDGTRWVHHWNQLPECQLGRDTMAEVA